LEKQIQKLDCKDCNSNWKLLSAHLSEAKEQNSPFLTSIMNKLFNESLQEMDKKLETILTFDSLVKFRDQLIEMGAFTMNNEQNEHLINLFEKVSDKNNLFSHTGFKTASMATRHVDFAKDTYAKMSVMTSMPEDKKTDYKERATSLSAGKDERIQMLSSIDGDHPEVRQYIEESKKVQSNLQNQYQMTCMGRMSQHNFTQCGELYNQLIAKQISSSKVESEYANAYNQNWNGIFSAWDNKRLSYNPQWKTSFMLAAPANSPNSKSYMYDPRSQQYSNFDASTLYQHNTVTPGTSTLYNPQDWSTPSMVQ